MRATDQAVPAITSPDRPGPDVPMGRWPAQLYVGIERTSSTFPRWDDLVSDWDGGEPGEVWDATGSITSGYIDAICDLQGLEFTSGRPSPEGSFDAGRLAMTLANDHGQWSAYDVFGHLTDYLPGRRLAVWAVLDGAPWWLWSGVITAWRETPDATVEVEGFDDFTVLNQNVGSWTPGAAGQTVAQRIAAVLATIGYTRPTRLDAGDVTLLARATENTPLEELQLSALSDGGILGVDADGTLIYRDRRWSTGRADQTGVPVLSDNVCTADAVVWAPVLATDDQTLVNKAFLTNVATPTPVAVTAENTSSRNLYGPHTMPEQRTEDLWQTSLQGQALADYIVARRGDSYLRIEECTLYLHDPHQDLWRIGIDRRLGDVVEFLHDAVAAGGGTARLDLYLAVVQLRHEITPDSWVVTLGTSKTTGNRLVYQWDLSPYTWDDPAPNNVWSP